ncbi:hypothetical protein E4U46_000583 [Claviceps purpurea]|nr:hypothetical protein E4U46_000583 [Claviceps purpurea]
MAQYVHSQALAMVLENLQKARERLKPSHREDGASFTRSAVLTNSNNTENRCCDDCVSAVLNERRGRPVSYGMYKSSSSNLFVTIGNVESREEGGSTDSPASTAVRAIEVPSIEAGNYTDDDFDLSSIEGDDASASLGSDMSSAYTNEYGRRYAVFGDVQYPFPMDEMEQSRGDMKHAILLMLTKNKLFLSPIGDNQQKILGIGTGTGSWAIDVDDCELDWIERDVDLVHFRYMVVLLKDTTKPLGHAFECLRPGGWVELQDFQPIPLCDDGTMPGDDPVKHPLDLTERAFEKFGMRFKLSAELEPYLREAGFENIHCKIFKVPIGPWAKDHLMRVVDLYQRLVVMEILPSMSGRLFHALEMSEAEAEMAIAMARKGLNDPNVHRYFNYYF